MATHSGVDGVIKVGSNAVAEVQDWSVNSAMDTIDDTQQSDTWVTHLPGKKSWSGQLTAAWDETDTSGQEALAIGASVTLNLYPEGASTGDTYWSGTATVTGIGITVPKNGLLTRAISFQGNGTLSQSTAA